MLPQISIDNKQKILDYMSNIWIPSSQIKNPELLLQAFIHKSFSADYKNIYSHNERLEFLGDWILSAVINKLLFLKHPEMDESILTLYKIALVREENLAQVARDIWLDQMIFISKWEEKMQWRKKDAIISDCLESILWYMYIDLWEQQTSDFIEKYIYSKILWLNTQPIKSYKTLIQELVQKHYKILPEYKDIEFEKDSKWNIVQYKSEIYVWNTKKWEWISSNKKKAQEEAAKDFYMSNLLEM